MLKVIFFIIAIFLMVSCVQADKPFLIRDVSMHSNNLVEKNGVPLVLRNNELLHTIDTNIYSFATVNEWFDHESILYLTDENGVSYLNKFHLFSGEDELFFQINEPILQVDANPDFSVFAIEVTSLDREKHLYFVNRKGTIIHKLNNVGEEFQIYWNPYRNHELIIAALQSDYSVKLKEINLVDKSIVDFNFEYSYVQWINESELAFLKWDLLSPSFYAPLYTYNLETEKKVKKVDDIIAFFSYYNHLLTITLDDIDKEYSQYTFYDMETNKKLTQFQVPVLNTYSEQWWIPNHAFDKESKTFYLLKPSNGGDLFSYSEGFSLVSIQVETGKEITIVNIDENYPLKLSPDGRRILFGYQLEEIIDLKKRKNNRLIYW
ncbi:hypothetical protein BKP45_09350 [Anaerobacillus alkalidiazotrophicus]|uniref:YqgU-like 6-bladed beta-propeller domain-containing protein n=1 Tax=Anaerobacillus alkalidiazotrophicus TaxID=472963 RepID=A0A1S2M6J6_9BACI|nr:hypothetical protein [Anaerobacillus alkalidiazotrophicus]OIJ20264.1 hypothetical protein BKP45_09350 [Anaerobacillus alkalidiazotrophicus]